MNAIFKRFAGWATHARSDAFVRAVVRLTVFYTAGVFLVMLVFSFLVYASFAEGVRSRFHDGVIRTPEEMEVYGELTERLFHILVVSDGLLLILTVFVSYGLSRATLTPLRRSYELQKQFVADAAHELRTPLSVIKAGSEMLLSQEREASRYKAFIGETLEEVNGLIGLSNDLLFLARHGGMSAKQQMRCDLGAICTKQLASMEAYAKQHDVVLTEAIAEGIFIMGDCEELQRLVRNLVKNAIDYNKEGGTVTCTVAQEDSHALIHIQDSGIGMTKEEASHVFERFYKADAARTHGSNTGTGLGLAIVKEIVVRHHGSIELLSTPGIGTRISVSFPRA